MDHVTPPEVQAEKTQRPPMPDKTQRPTAPVSEATQRPPAPSGDKTQRPPANEKTQRPGAPTGDKTQRPGQVAADKTQRAGNKPQEDTALAASMAPMTEYTLDGVTYQVVQVISKSTGEGEILLIENQGKQYVLKLYFPDYKLPGIDIMEAICQSAGTGLLVATYRYGQWRHPIDKVERDYELMEYCSGGSLDQIKLNGDEKLLGEIALQCAVCIDFLHKKHIIHRDIKPANFFFRHPGQQIEDLTLADFGIAIMANSDGKILIDYQPRTKIYTAPEYYFSVEGKIQISYKSDFYSLGMMLLTLLNGEEIFCISEYELIDLKRSGRLPYPTNVSDRTLQLLKALTDMTPDTRAGLPELIRWAQGEDIYDIRKTVSAEDFNIIFNQSKNQVATSIAELGQLMYDEKELATKYLYSGKVAEWLTANKCPEIAIEMEDIVENQYPQDKKAGLIAACYFLKPTIPYEDVKGQALTSQEEIAASLRANKEYYERALANKNDSLFLFFNAHGAMEYTQTYAPLFNQNADNRDALRQLLFTLDPTLPWIITDEAGGETICNELDDLLIFQGTCQVIWSDESWMDLLSESFFEWVGTRDPIVEGRIRSREGHKTNPWCVIYNLNQKVSYNFVLDENADDYFFSAADIGHYMNNQIVDYLGDQDENSFASNELNMLCHIDGTRLYHYLKSKEVYDDKIEWIKYCMDVNSKENSEKYGPYNWRIGAYKAIDGLGFNSYYYFPESDTVVYSLEELEQVSKEEIQKELNDGYLDDWLTLFYQENPQLDLKEQYAFENETVDYVEYLEKLDPQLNYVLDYRTGTQVVNEDLTKLKKTYAVNLWSRIIIAVLMLAGVIGSSYLLLINEEISFDINGKWITWGGLIVALLVGGWRNMYCMDGFIKSLLIAILTLVVVVLAVGAGVAYPTYTAAVLLVGWFIWAMLSCYAKRMRRLKKDNELFNPGFEELYLEPLHFAFRASADATYRSSIGDRTDNAIYDYKDYTKKLYTCCLPFIIVCAGVIALMTNVDRLTGVLQGVATKSTQYEQAIGTYTGKFGDNSGEFIIEGQNGNKVEATIKVRFTNLVEEKLVGEIDMSKGTFHFDDVVSSNGKLDGQYNGTFNSDFTTMQGTYENYTSKKQVQFQFTK